jgi:hypothetical protein
MEVVVSLTLRPLYPQGKIPWYPLGRRNTKYILRIGTGFETINLVRSIEVVKVCVKLVN